MNQKQLYEMRKERFNQGLCPVCEKRVTFLHTGTRMEGSSKIRSMKCPLCESTFRVHVFTEVRFSKVTKEGESAL